MSFDPYHKWLGIRRDGRTLTHYQILGLSPSEQDAEVIRAAALRHSGYVRNFQNGPHANEAAQVLAEIAAAQACLLDASKRAEYDATLQAAAPRATNPAPAPDPKRTAGRSSRSAPQRLAEADLEDPLFGALPPAASSYSSPLLANLPSQSASGTSALPGRPKVALVAVVLIASVSAVLALCGGGVVYLVRWAGGQLAAQREQAIPAGGQPFLPPAVQVPFGGEPTTPFWGSQGLPAGTATSVLLGGPGGGEITRCGTGQPLLGVRFNLGDWAGQDVVQDLVPLYAIPSSPTPAELCAKAGYAVGALDVDADDFVNAVRLVYFRSEGERLNPADSYFSPWIGYPTGRPLRRLGGDAAPVVGIWGRQGLILNAVGVVARGKASDPALQPSAVTGPPPQPAHSPKWEFGRHDLPAGSRQTDYLGGPGGGGFIRARSGKGPLVGFSFKLGQWSNQKLVQDLLPLYAADYDAASPELASEVRAKDGYVVGGMEVDANEFVNAVRLVFLRIDGQRLNPADSYLSPWIGFPTGGKSRLLGGSGTAVLGVCGRQGLILNAVGLVVGEDSLP